MTGRVGAVGRGPECLGDQYGVPVCCSSLESHAQRGGRHLTLGTARQPGQLPPPSNSSRGLADQCLVASVRRRRCGAIADSAGRSTVDAAPPAPDILGAASRVQDGSGVVLLTDMFGGTPSNLAISAMEGGRIEVICGINLPMLIKLATLRDSANLDQAVIEARDAGRKYITVASKVLAGK